MLCYFRRPSPVPTAVACAAVLVVALAPAAALAQNVPTLLFEGKTLDAVTNALYEACYEAGMTVEAVAGPSLVCRTALEGDERQVEGIAVAEVSDGVVWHRIRFALAERTGGIRVWAYPSIEIVEADGVSLDEDIDSAPYLGRVQDVLAAIDADLGAGAVAETPREPWKTYYESEHAWRLDAHLKSVDYCDRHLEALDSDEIEDLLEAAGVHPLGRSLRDRCEELYLPVYEWGLARGIAEPTVEAYAEYRASLPADERCTGRLALRVTCP